MARWLPALLAVSSPLAVGLAGMSALERVRTLDDLTQERNVGAVLNGRQIHQSLLDAIDAELARTEPEVVLLGNSIANTDFAARTFAAQTGVPQRRIARLSVPNTMAAHWYAILKNRVYAAGHRPRLVVAVSDLQSLLAVTPRSEASHVALTLQLGPDEPVIDGKLGRRWWVLDRVRENRTVFRDRATRRIRNALVDVVVRRSLAPLDPRPTDEALSRVFADDRVDNQRHKRVLPVFNVTEPFEVTFDEVDLAPVARGFAPDLLDLVAEHGGTFVFVRPPMSPRLPAGYGDIVPDTLAEDVPDAFTAAGHEYLDLRALPLTPSHFQNLDHMNEEGARRFTWVLAEALRDRGRVGEAREPGVDLLRSFRVEGGVLSPRRVPVHAGRPGHPPGGFPPLQDGRGRSAAFPARHLAALSDVATLPVTPQGSRCSPVRVVEWPAGGGPGTLLGPANVSCEEVFRLGLGRTCHVADRVFFAPSDDTDAWDNGRTYTLELDPRRACPEARWTYPGDVVGLPVPPPDARDLEVSELRARAVDFGPQRLDSAVRVTVLRDGVEVASRVVQTAMVVHGITLPFPPSPAGSLEVRLTNTSGRFLLWDELFLGR